MIKLVAKLSQQIKVVSSIKEYFFCCFVNVYVIAAIAELVESNLHYKNMALNWIYLTKDFPVTLLNVVLCVSFHGEQLILQMIDVYKTNQALRDC